MCKVLQGTSHAINIHQVLLAKNVTCFSVISWSTLRSAADTVARVHSSCRGQWHTSNVTLDGTLIPPAAYVDSLRLASPNCISICDGLRSCGRLHSMQCKSTSRHP